MGCRKLYYALRRYPPHKIQWKIDVLASGFSSDNALTEAEIFYIKKFNTLKLGYNCTIGGEGLLGLRHTDETKRKIAIAHTGFRHTEKTKKKISDSKSGTNTGPSNYMFGKSLSEEARRKISEAAKSRTGWKHSKETREKIGTAHRGMKASEETKKKVAAASAITILSRKRDSKTGRLL